MINIKRIYEPSSAKDGYRVLIDRLWPRGINKDQVKVDEWLREVAPSDELRKWFGHEPEKWPEFRNRYLKELDTHVDAVKELLKRIGGRDFTILYGARDEEHNNAVVFKEYVEKM